MHSVEDREPKKEKGLDFRILKILSVSQGGSHLSWKAEAGGSLKHRISEPNLGNIVKTSPQIQKMKTKSAQTEAVCVYTILYFIFNWHSNYTYLLGTL